MKLTHSLVVLVTAITFCSCKAESHFQKCAEQFQDKKDLLCKIRNLEVDGNMPKAKEFMNCAFSASGWTDKDGKKFDVPKLVEDMKVYGFQKQTELEQVTKKCKKEFGDDVSAIDYLACLLIDGRTKKEFKMTLMFKEADFFKQNLCKGL